MITIEGLSKTYAGTGRPALNDIALQIPKGAIYGILGRSGAGKSTLIRCLNLLERPTSGRILVNGQDITQLNKAALRDYRLRTGMIFQHFNLLHARTVADNCRGAAGDCPECRGPLARPGCANCWRWWISAKRPPLSRHSFPAGKSSASA